MKKILVLVLAFAMTISLFACGQSSNSGNSENNSNNNNNADPITIRVSMTISETHQYSVGLKKYMELVKERTGGKVEFDVYYEGVLGSDRDNVEGLQLGTSDMAVCSTGTIANFLSDYSLLDLPYLFADANQARAALDSELGDFFLKQMDGIGIVAPAFWENGFRCITNDVRPINSVADMEGIKLRTMENAVHMAAFKACGADPTPMAWGEVFTALNQGTIDGQENPVTHVLTYKLYEVQAYLAMTNHVYSPSLVMFSKAFYDALPSEIQTVLYDTAREVAPYERSVVDDMISDAVAECEANGMAVTYPNVAEFRTVMTSVYDQFVTDSSQKDIVNKLMTYGS